MELRRFSNEEGRIGGVYEERKYTSGYDTGDQTGIERRNTWDQRLRGIQEG